LGPDDLPPEAGPEPGPSESGMTAPAGADGLVGKPLADVERYYTERALELTAGNREEAAKMLGIGERTLYRKLIEWKKT
jgi:two-component system, NtrC family, response regulator HydG